MEITQVKIRKLIPEADIESGSTRIRAIVSIIIDGVFAVHDIKIIQGIERVFVAMPKRAEKAGKFQDIVHPIDAGTRSMVETVILDANESALQQMRQPVGGEARHRNQFRFLIQESI